MKTTIVRIQNFVSAASIFLTEYKENEKAVEAVKRVAERATPLFGEYHKLLSDIKLTLANTDKNGSLLYNPNDQKEFAYTKEGYKELQKRTFALQAEERFEIDPITIDADLIPEIFHETFEGFIINKVESELK